MAFFSTLLGVTGAVGGGALGYFGADAQNDAIVANAYAQQDALNENIERARFAFFDNQRAATSQFQRAQGNLSNQLFAGGRSGHSLNRLLAAQSNDFMKDDLARKRNLAQTIENIETQKRNVARSASSQTTNPWVAAIGGAAQGAQVGSSIGAGIDGAVQGFQDSAFLKDLNAQYAADPSNIDLQAQVSAISSGVSPSFMQQYPSLSTAPFRSAIQTNNLGFQAAQLGLQSAQQQAQFSSFMNQNSLYQLNQLGGSIFGGLH